MRFRLSLLGVLVAALTNAAAFASIAPPAPPAPPVPAIRSKIGCDVRRIPAQTKLVVFSVHGGDAMSSAFIGSPDHETKIIDVTVEPGQQPLFLVLTSYQSMIWRITGATHRVARVLVSSHMAAPRTLSPVKNTAPAGKGARRSVEQNYKPAAVGEVDSSQWSLAGVIGIPANRVIIRHADCPRAFLATSGPDFEAAMSDVLQRLGRRPYDAFWSNSPRWVSMPSGTVAHVYGNDAPVPYGFDAIVWRDAVRYWRGGLVIVDPASVVSKASVAPYRVLPSQMGLAQLVGAGAVERLSDERYRIVKPIAHMPAGMAGGHSVKLILAKGVPLPPGDPLHSCIEYEDGSRPASAALSCRGSR